MDCSSPCLSLGPLRLDSDAACHVLEWLAPSEALQLSRVSRCVRRAVLALSSAWSSRLRVLVQPARPLPPGLGPLARVHVCEPPPHEQQEGGAEAAVLGLLTSPSVRCAALRGVTFADRSALCSTAVLRALAALDAPLADVRVTLCRRRDGEGVMSSARAVQELARRHAGTLRTLHVYCWPGTCFELGGGEDPDDIWGNFPASTRPVGDAVARGLAEGYARMAQQGQQRRAPLQSLVFEAVSLAAVIEVVRSAPGGVLPELVELVGLQCGRRLQGMDEGALAEVRRRCPALCRAQRASPDPEEVYIDCSVAYLPYTSLVLTADAPAILEQHPGPYPLVQHLDIYAPQCDGVMLSLADHFPNVASLCLLDDFGADDDPARAAVLAGGLKRFACLRQLNCWEAFASLQQQFSGFGGLRELCLNLGTADNLWMARVPGMLSNVETLHIELGPGTEIDSEELQSLRLDVSGALKRLTIWIAETGSAPESLVMDCISPCLSLGPLCLDSDAACHVLEWLTPSEALQLSRVSRCVRPAVLALSSSWSSRPRVLVQPARPLPPGLGPLARVHVCEPPLREQQEDRVEAAVPGLLESPSVSCAA
eukprot:m51a1_g743 hypothetical protein (596) ;mRNA; r:504751-507166